MNTIKKKILIADDDPAILDALMLMLQEVGYDVETTLDGQIIHTMKKRLPDLLLLDIWMSGTDGRDICAQLKKQEQTKELPIIMISANRNVKAIAKNAGADDFLAKPFQMDELFEKVTKYIGPSSEFSEQSS